LTRENVFQGTAKGSTDGASYARNYFRAKATEAVREQGESDAGRALGLDDLAQSRAARINLTRPQKKAQAYWLGTQVLQAGLERDQEQQSRGVLQALRNSAVPSLPHEWAAEKAIEQLAGEEEEGVVLRARLERMTARSAAAEAEVRELASRLAVKASTLPPCRWQRKHPITCLSLLPPLTTHESPMDGRKVSCSDLSPLLRRTSPPLPLPLPQGSRPR